MLERTRLWARSSVSRIDQTGGVARRALVHEEPVEGTGSAIDKIQVLVYPDHARRDAVRHGVEVAFDRRERHAERRRDTVEIATS
jgi:hypothetical protein